MLFIIGIFSFSAQALNNADRAEHPSVEEQIFEQLGTLTLLELAPLTKEEIIERLQTDLNVHVKIDNNDLFDRYFLSYIYNYFHNMKPNNSSWTPYNLYALRYSSQRLVSIRPGNNLYFSKNAGEATITRRFMELMDEMSRQKYSALPDQMVMTLEYNNELYAQLNEAILSVEEIKDFINKHSGIVFQEDKKSFTRDELLMILKQYLDLPVHVRDNLALEKMVRVEKTKFSLWNIFGTTLGRYDDSTGTITLTDAAFEMPNTDDQGEDTTLHEIGHALWGKSVFGGLPPEVKEDYKRLSWQGDEVINDEFISSYAARNVKEDFASHFAAYINEGEMLKHEVEAKYYWFREHIFLGMEYIVDVADNLKIFVESEHGDITPPYLVGLPYESFIITFSLEDTEAADYLNGRADVQVEVSGLFDNASKIKSVDILLQSENDHFWINSPKGFKFCGKVDPDKVPTDCVLIDPNKPGRYVYHSSQRLALSYPENYKITQVKLEDEAGNKKTLRSNLGEATLPFPGTRNIVEEEEAKRKRNREEAKRRKKELEEKARRKKERAEEAAKKKRERIEERARRYKAAEEAKGFNILNFSKMPVKVYSNDEELETLEFGECLSITESELSQLSLETKSDWFDWELDTTICSNHKDTSRCKINEASLIKKNKNKYVLADYSYEFEADFSQCKPSLARYVEQKEEARLKKWAEEATGLNIFNLSESLIRIYQEQEVVLDLAPKQCFSIAEQDLLTLTLKKIDGWSDEGAVICTNLENSLNIQKCDVTVTSLVKQNVDGKYVLTNYQGEKSADFSQCIPLTPEATSIDETNAPPSDAEDTKDTTPPDLTHAPSESVFVSILDEDFRRDQVLIKVEVKGLFDDMSEIQVIDLRMNSVKGSFWLMSPRRLCEFTPRNLEDTYYSDCIFTDPKKPGYYVYYERVRKKTIYPGNYRLDVVDLADTLQNERRIGDFENNVDHHTFFFPGRKLWVSWKELTRDLQIITSKTSDLDTVVHIFITDMRDFDLGDLYVQVTDVKTGEKLKYQIDPNELSSLNTQFNSPNIPGKMSLPIIIPKELTSGKYQLDRISFERPSERGEYFDVKFSAFFDHLSYAEDRSTAQPVVDDIVMDVVKGANRRGGDTSIQIDVPIEGLDKGDGDVNLIVRTPTGDQLSYSASLKTNPHNGSRHIQGLLRLGPRHAEGEYMITYIATTEDYSDRINNRINHHKGLRLLEGGKRTHGSRLLERGIRTTLRVAPPPPEREKH